MNRALMVILLAVPFAFAAPVPKALKKKENDAEKFVGVWDEYQNGGQTWFFNADGTGGVAERARPSNRAIFKIDPDQSPKHIDWSVSDGKIKYLGVYEFDGETLKMSFALGNSGIRPSRVEEEKAHTWVVATRRKEANK